jgi:hypothetical protein
MGWKWLHHEYENGGVRIYRCWAHTPEWIYAPQYFWVRLQNKISQRNKIDLTKIKTQKEHIP